MQEAMDMTPEEFDAAAHQLLMQEQSGGLRLPSERTASPTSGAADYSSGGGSETDYPESEPLRGAPARFRDEGGASGGGPVVPSRRKRGGGGSGGSSRTNLSDPQV